LRGGKGLRLAIRFRLMRRGARRGLCRAVWWHER
jgi:hypothetical protein